MMIYGDDDENGGLLHLPMKRIVKQFGECFCVCLLGGGVGHILMTMMKYILQYTIMYNSILMILLFCRTLLSCLEAEISVKIDFT